LLPGLRRLHGNAGFSLTPDLGRRPGLFARLAAPRRPVPAVCPQSVDGPGAHLPKRRCPVCAAAATFLGRSSHA